MQNETCLHKVMTWFERIIIAGLILLMAVTVLFSALDLAWLLFEDLIAPPRVRMDVNELLDTFGLFLLVLIGLELLETFKAYLADVRHLAAIQSSRYGAAPDKAKSVSGLRCSGWAYRP